MNVPRSTAVLVPRPQLMTACTHYRPNTLWWWQQEGRPYPACPPDYSMHCYGGEKECSVQRNERMLLIREKAQNKAERDMLEY